MSTTDRNHGVRFETVGTDHGGQRLDNWLTSRLKGVPRSLVYRLIRTGQVRIDGKRAKAATRLEVGDTVRIPPVRVAERSPGEVPDRAVYELRDRVLFANEDLLVMDKPSGMAVHSGSGLSWGLIDVVRKLYPDEFVELVHRLDRETSGCLVIARNGSALNHLSALFREGDMDKRYLCLLHGSLEADRVDVDAPLARVEGKDNRRIVVVSNQGKTALTRFRRLQGWPGVSYAEAELLTGRTHQIRAHARHIGAPVAGDARYSERESQKYWRKRGLKRLFLHAHSIGFKAPDGSRVDVHAPLPEDLRAVLDGLD